MLEALVLLSAVVLGLWIYQFNLSGRLTSYIESLERDLKAMRESVQRLTSRIYALEHPAEPVQKPARQAAAPQAPPAPVLAPVPEASPVTWERDRLQVPERPLPQPVLEEAAGQGWEAVLGGNWLNKIGVLVLVIGLALFIGYSFTLLGPAGRVAVSVAVSVSMLGAGAVLERREKYKVFARGLLGGGWAALYSTTYSAHAIEAARVITDPKIATLLLVAVAAGMILHSLYYQLQSVTGVAYFVAFVTLAITQLNFFAVVALAPLAASLLYLAHRFRWTGMARLGLPATYGIYFLQMMRSSGGSLPAAQAILFVYWLVFEGFDLLEAVNLRGKAEKPCQLFPMNAVAFLGVSLVQWLGLASETVYQLFVWAAAAYLVNSLVRVLLLPPHTFAAESTALDRARQGGFEGALTLSAMFTAVAILLKLSGLSVSLALGIEAEVLFLAGVYLGMPFLRGLGTVLFSVSVAQLVVVDVPESKRLTVGGTEWRAWSPVALFQAAVFYLNRSVLARGAFFSTVAAGLMALVLGVELRAEFVGLGWLLLCFVLYEFGQATQRREFAIQSYVVGGLSLFALVFKNVLDTGLHTGWQGWMPQLCGAVLLYGTAARCELLRERNWDASEQDGPRKIASVAGTILLAAFLRNVLPSSLTVVAWALLSLMLLLAGRRLGKADLQIQSCLLAVICFFRAWAVNLELGGSYAGLPASILSTAAVISIFYAAEFVPARPSASSASMSNVRAVLEEAMGQAGSLFSWLATALLAVLLFHEVAGRVLTVAWGIQGLSLLLAGFPLRERCLRLSGLVLLLGCVLKLFLYDLRYLDMPHRVASFLVLGVILIGVSFFYSRFRERISRFL